MSIRINFMTALPETRKKSNLMTVVVDRFPTRCDLIAFQHPLKGADPNLVMHLVIAYHSLFANDDQR